MNKVGSRLLVVALGLALTLSPSCAKPQSNAIEFSTTAFLCGGFIEIEISSHGGNPLDDFSFDSYAVKSFESHYIDENGVRAPLNVSDFVFTPSLSGADLMVLLEHQSVQPSTLVIDAKVVFYFGGEIHFTLKDESVQVHKPDDGHWHRCRRPQ